MTTETDQPGSLTPTEDADVVYTYAHARVGNWSDPINWIVGSGTPATTAPGANDAVIISGDQFNPQNLPYDLIGPGAADSLLISHGVIFDGDITANTLTIAPGSPMITAPVSVFVESDATLDVGQASLSSQLSAIGVGASFIVGGALQIGIATDPTSLAGSPALSTQLGGSIQAGSVDLGRGTITIDSSGSMLVGADAAIHAGMVSLGQDGVLQVETGTVDSEIWNDGLLRVTASGTPFADAVHGSGTIAIEAGVDLFLPVQPDDTQHVRFDGPNAVLETGDIWSQLGPIDGFDATDEIILGTGSSPIGTVSVTDDGTSSATLVIDTLSSETTLTFDGDYEGRTFNVVSQRLGAGGPIVTVTDSVACFCPGTLIATPAGERPVESLAIGDHVLTADGMSKPLLWIGHRSYDRRFAAGNAHILPIRICAGALGDGLPRRDLLVSPKHAMRLGDGLVPAGLLVNGVSILQETAEDDIQYLHLELDTHELLLAEGAATESFVDDDSRCMFQNAAEYAALYPDRTSGEPVWCAPRITHGSALEAIRRRIDALANLEPPPPLPRLQVQLDQAEDGLLRGWAWCPAHPDVPVWLSVLVDGRPVAELVADGFRADLQAAGIGAGCHGFSLAVPGLTAESVVTFSRSVTAAATERQAA